MGTEAIWIPAAMAALSAGTQYANQSSAQNRANTAETQAINNQMALRNKANSQVQQMTHQIAASNPNAIQGQETGDFVNALRRNAAGSTQGGPTSTDPTNYGASVSALAPVVGGSSRYNAGTAASQKEVQGYGNTTANQLGAIDAAVRQRQQEGLGMETLGTNLNTVGAQSYMQNFVDQLRAQSAGQQNPWVGLFSKMAGGAANAYGMNAGGAGAGSGVSGGISPSGFYSQGGYLTNH